MSARIQTETVWDLPNSGEKKARACRFDCIFLRFACQLNRPPQHSNLCKTSEVLLEPLVDQRDSLIVEDSEPSWDLKTKIVRLSLIERE